MSFDYNRGKKSHDSDSFWTSYSDLFLGLSTIFLLLYVTASLRTGTDAIKSQVENQKLTMEVDELKGQLKMYEQIKADYLEKQASKDETQEYQELMDKLTLLKEDAKTDKERLARQALENERKAEALNKYQQMVRNIINANKVAKTKIITRNDVINEQDETIEEQATDITDLNQQVTQKEAQIAASEKKIAQAKAELASSKDSLKKALKNHKITQAQYEQRMHKMQEQSNDKIENLQAANRNAKKQLVQLTQSLEGTELALANKQKEADSLKGQTEALKGEASALRGQTEGLKGQINQMRSKFAADQAKERAAFDAELKKGKMDAAERERREGEFRASAARKEKELQGKIAGLSGKLHSTEGELAKAKEEMDVRKEIAREIKKGFAKAGIKADVDMGTGEVVLDFGDHYFESNSSDLKPEMKDIIERAMPVYSKSLFGNQKVADKISAVEIIGFASPTYKGRYVDPKSNKPEDKAALKYNMDLSYRRANSIFGYLVEGRNVDFDHRKDLMGLMKVSGRSFLEVMKVQGGRKPANAAEFCKQNDCKKAQKVIVRFSIDGK